MWTLDGIQTITVRRSKTPESVKKRKMTQLQNVQINQINNKRCEQYVGLRIS